MESVETQEKVKVFHMFSADGIHFLLRDSILGRYGIKTTEENDRGKKGNIRRLKGIVFLFIPLETKIDISDHLQLSITDVIRIWDSNPLIEQEGTSEDEAQKGPVFRKKTGVDVMREYFSRKTYPEVPSLRPEVYMVSRDYLGKEVLVDLLKKEDPEGIVEFI